MTKYLALVALILTALGCVQTGAVTCQDDRTCPTDTLCHPTLPLCVSHAAKLGCEGKADGDPCVAGADPGICETGFCIPGCGDGQADDREECDDGNFRSHDGCSSSCLLEQRSWIEWHPDWSGRSHHMLAYHEERKELLMFGGGDDVGAFTDHWTRHADLTWTRSASPLGIRTQAMVASVGCPRQGLATPTSGSTRRRARGSITRAACFRRLARFGRRTTPHAARS